MLYVYLYRDNVANANNKTQEHAGFLFYFIFFLPSAENGLLPSTYVDKLLKVDTLIKRKKENKNNKNFCRDK